jgi:hypothetical protein
MKWLLGAVLLMAAPSFAGTLHMTIKAPCSNYVGPGCPDVDANGDYRPGPPLTDLSNIVIQLVRFDTGETLTLAPIPVSTPCDSVPFDIIVQDGIQGEVLGYAEDTGGNRSCLGPHYVFAMPLNSAPAVTPGLHADYYEGTNFQTWRHSRVEPTIDFSLGANPAFPDMLQDNWSARWQGFLDVPTTGDWTFYLSGVEDGARLMIDGVLTVNGWVAEHGGTLEFSGVQHLTAGSHSLTCEFFDQQGWASAHLNWAGPGVSKQLVAGNYLSH